MLYVIYGFWHSFDRRCQSVTVHEKYLAVENFGKLYREKLLVRKNLVNKVWLVYSYAKYIFGVPVNIGKENFGE